MSIRIVAPRMKRANKLPLWWTPCGIRTSHVPRANSWVDGFHRSKTLHLRSFRIVSSSDTWVRSFWLRAIKSTPVSFQRRFIESFQRYVDSVVQQSSDREHRCQRNIEDYLTIRRYTIGAEPSFVANAMYMDLPDHVVEHPTLRRLELLAIDMIVMGNDIVSYDRE